MIEVAATIPAASAHESDLIDCAVGRTVEAVSDGERECVEVQPATKKTASNAPARIAP